jgi:hypothetical protein
MVRRARLDPSLHVQVRTRAPLHYAEGPDPSLDRPGHVRAGSSVAWLGARLAVVQDDASFVALVDADGCRAVTLPAGAGGKRQFDERRGNKKDKLDLEASAILGGALWAFGSGSAPGRDRVVRLGEDGRVDLIPAARLYAAFMARTDFRGSELNVEGVLAQGGDVWFFNRGNGAPAPGGELAPIDATVRVEAAALLRYLDDPANAPVPSLLEVVRYDLGAVAGCRLTFTDATFALGEQVYLAAAEASPDATRDGPVAGVALGFLADEPRYAMVRDERGALLTDKLEGITPARTDGAGNRLFAVVDKDDPDAPSELVELEVVASRE